jgi:hypothetical protein
LFMKPPSRDFERSTRAEASLFCWNRQTLGVPRQSRGFTLRKLVAHLVDISYSQLLFFRAPGCRAAFFNGQLRGQRLYANLLYFAE